MLDNRGEALVLGGLILYLVVVVFSLSLLMTGEGEVLGISPYNFKQSFAFTGDNKTLLSDIPQHYTKNGEWIDTDGGVMSNGTELNTLLFIKNLDMDYDAGGNVQEYQINNTANMEFRIFSQYTNYIFGLASTSNGYDFRADGIHPYVNSNQYRDTISYLNGTDFNYPKIRAVFSWRVDTGVRIRTLTLFVNDREIDRVTLSPSSGPLIADYWYGGVEVTGQGLYIEKYARTLTSRDNTSTEWDTSIWGFITTLGYITGWTLPAEYFTTDFAMWLFAIIDVIAIKIPIVIIGYILLRLGRGGG